MPSLNCSRNSHQPQRDHNPSDYHGPMNHSHNTSDYHGPMNHSHLKDPVAMNRGRHSDHMAINRSRFSDHRTHGSLPGPRPPHRQVSNRHQYNDNSRFCDENVFNHSNVQNTVMADFSDRESVGPEDSISCIQNQVDSIIRYGDWDRKSSTNRLSHIGVRPFAQTVLRPDMSGESLLRGGDVFRDNSGQEVDLALVKDEPQSDDDDVRTIDSPPHLAETDIVEPYADSVVNENINDNNTQDNHSSLDVYHGSVDPQTSAVDPQTSPDRQVSREKSIEESEVCIV